MLKKNLSNSFLTIIVVGAFAVGYFGPLLKNEIYWAVQSHFISNIPTKVQISPKPIKIFPEGKTEIPAPINLFNSKIIVSAKKLGPKNELYYLKDGNIMLAQNFKLGQPVKAKTLIDVDKEILLFQLNNNNTQIAYTIRQGEKDPIGFSSNYGDTIIIRDINTEHETTLYSRSASELDVRNLMYTPDDTKLVYGTNVIGIIDLSTKEVTKYLPRDTKSFCPLYFIDDISPNGQIALVQLGCMEGSTQYTVNIQTGKKLGEFPIGYAEGGFTAYGFINDANLIGHDDKHDVHDTDHTSNTKISIFDISGNLIKNLTTISSPHYNGVPIVYWKSNSDELHIALRQNEDEPKYDTYKLTTYTFVMTKSDFTDDIIIDTTDKGYGSIWFTNTNLESPIFIARRSENSYNLNVITR